MLTQDQDAQVVSNCMSVLQQVSFSSYSLNTVIETGRSKSSLAALDLKSHGKDLQTRTHGISVATLFLAQAGIVQGLVSRSLVIPLLNRIKVQALLPLQSNCVICCIVECNVEHNCFFIVSSFHLQQAVQLVSHRSRVSQSGA